MTLKQFIRENKEEIDAAIKSSVGKEAKKNNAERRLWILNDEGLFRWAQSMGVKI